MMNTTDMDFAHDEHDIWISHVTSTTDTGKYQACCSLHMPICLYYRSKFNAIMSIIVCVCSIEK